MSKRLRICLAVWIVTVACSAICGTIQADVFDSGDGWLIEVSPAMKSPARTEVIMDAPLTIPADDTTNEAAPAPDTSSIAVPVAAGTPGDEYRRIYQSIPFNRAEFNANPSYRHDSTMEILTGIPRHQTIVQHNNTPVVQPRPRPRTFLLPSRYNQRRRGLNHYYTVPYWNYGGTF
jgi:hypothetical protein